MPKLEDATTRPKPGPPLDDKKTKKKRKSEVENLEIQMKGWSSAGKKSLSQASPKFLLMTAPTPAVFLKIAACYDVTITAQLKQMVTEDSLGENRDEVTDLGLEESSIFNDLCKLNEENNMFLV